MDEVRPRRKGTYQMNGEALESLRTQRGLTRAKFAKKGGLSESGYDRWVAGGKAFYGFVVAFAKAHNTTPDRIAIDFPSNPDELLAIPTELRAAIIRVDVPVEHRDKMEACLRAFEEILRAAGVPVNTVQLNDARPGSVELEVIGPPEYLALLNQAFQAGSLRRLGVTGVSAYSQNSGLIITAHEVLSKESFTSKFFDNIPEGRQNELRSMPAEELLALLDSTITNEHMLHERVFIVSISLSRYLAGEIDKDTYARFNAHAL